MSEATFKLAVVRSEALRNFHEALRASGVPSLEANELTGERAKYLDNYEATQAAVATEMERKQ